MRSGAIVEQHRPALRRARVLAGIVAVALALSGTLVAAHADPPDRSRLGAPQRLRADGLADPLGIDSTRPALGWAFGDPGRDTRQTAYEIRAASSEQLLRSGRPDLWDTGRVRSATNEGVRYAGRAVDSRDQVFWQVRVWDESGTPSSWSRTATWEVGLLHAKDWSAQWIGNPTWEQPVAHPMPVSFTPATGRYVRVTVTHLEGATTDPAEADRQARLELGEITVADSKDPGTDLAKGATVTASESRTVPGEWGPEHVTDGTLLSDAAPRGYSSEAHRSLDVSGTPIVLTIDLGQVRTFDQVRLYPRTDIKDQFARTANYPRDFAVSTSDTADGAFRTLKSLTWQDPPSATHPKKDALPLFATSFDVGVPVRSARLHITGMGIYDATINGHPVSDAVLEPPNTEVRKQVVASTYDVTDLVRKGANSIGAEVGTGIAQVSRPASNRYQYMNSDYSPPRLLAQLEITTVDGRRQVVGTDGSWRTTLGATTFSNWYGGEDYDARRSVPGWDRAGHDRSDWQAPTLTGKPFPGTQVTGRTAPPVEPVDTLAAKAITEPTPGTYLVDFGTNVAGWPELRADGPAGTEVRMYPGEQLDKAGLVLQTQYSGHNRVWQSMTLDGDGPITWHPRFNYSGFRYVEITGLPAKPSADDVHAIVLRTADEQAGTFTSSDPLLNDIHAITNRAMQSNMYSVFTDCPHREKFAWLEQLNLVFDSMSKNYDVLAHYRKALADMADAQLPSGLVPDITPELTEFTQWNLGYRDDPNWGGSIILAPWDLYRTYGDSEVMERYYPNMQRYLDYLTQRSHGHLLDGGLGDWIAIDTTTPLDLVATQAYYKLASTLGDIAGAIGRPADAKRYADLAAQVRTAFNDRFFDADAGSYGPGNEASNGLALDAGLVPSGDRDRVLTNLVDGIRADGNHLEVGEVALPAIFDVLAEAGRDDVIYDLATQTTYPSYGYLVRTGSTALPEAWTGMTKSGSQNHYMLGALDDWFWSGLGGIEQAPGSVAFHDLVIAPAVVGDLTSNDATYRTPQGEVATSWTRTDQALSLDVTVPANTTATVEVPLDRVGGRSAALDAGGLRPVSVDEHTARYEVGSGTWHFTAERG